MKTCSICERETDDPVADHCHETGAIRDWLCRRCNAGLGMFQDNPEALRAAADYLERHRANPRDAVAFVMGELSRCHPRSLSRRAAKHLNSEA